MDISDSIRQLEDRFVENPANYIVEAELVFDLKRILNEQLPPARLKGTHDSGNARGSIPDHSEYADAIVSTDQFDRAHCEVSGSNFGLESEQRRLDLVVFSDEVRLSLENGSKKFRAEDLTAAVEFKFLKNTKYLRSGSDRYNWVTSDIDRLAGLPDHVDTYCLVFGNFDLARRPDTEEALQDLKSRNSRVSVHHTHPLS